MIDTLSPNLKKENSTLGNQFNDRVLIVDGYNTFIRCFTANPTMNEDGIHVGGIAGFLKSVGYAARLLDSTRIVVVFDGAGGSMRRRALYKEYKQSRKSKIRLNRIYEDIADLTDDEESMKRQLIRIFDYLDFLPVHSLSIDNVEADDVIAYCALQYFEKHVDIMSSDKDFLQLADDRINIWSPTKKRAYGPAEIVSDYGIHPYNFVIYRALDGDTSDNIPGIRGFALKTTLKAFPMLAEPRNVEPQEMYNHATANRKKLKVYETLIEHRNDFERNLALMQLSDTYLTTQAQLNINSTLDQKVKKLNRFGFTDLVRQDKMSGALPHHISWVNEAFGKIGQMILTTTF